MNISFHHFVVPLLALMLPPAMCAGEAEIPDAPEVWPTCNAPQPLAAPQPVGAGYAGARAAVVWNGADYGVFWVDGLYAELRFRRFFADGTPAGPAVTLAPGGGLMSYANAPPAVLWTGSQYAIAWTVSGGGVTHAYFALLNPAGAFSSGPTRVSNTGGGTLTSTLTVSDLAAAGPGGGDVLLVLWNENKGTGTGADVYATILNPSGTIAYHDLVVDNATGDQTDAQAYWADASYQFAIVENHALDILRSRYVYPYGLVSAASFTLVDAAGVARRPHLAFTPAGPALAWVDTRDGSSEIYFGMLNFSASGFTATGRLTVNAVNDGEPQLGWTGSEFLVAYQSVVSGRTEIMIQRADADALPVGQPARMTWTAESDYPAIARGGSGYLLASREGMNSMLVTPVGCAADATPPGCAGNYVVYGVTGTGATVSWSPATDLESDVAGYAVYRNNALIARTSQTYYTDGGLSPSGTYDYMVQPVNASQLQNGACTGSVYVKTNATLTLTVSKASASDAGLAWTDAGYNNYNLFRGATPQVLSQIGATPELSSTDPNALTGTVSYFYSVDNPGP